MVAGMASPVVRLTAPKVPSVRAPRRRSTRVVLSHSARRSTGLMMVVIIPVGVKLMSSGRPRTDWTCVHAW